MKKFSPKARKAGADPWIKEKMTPPRMSKTMTAAARVICRKNASPPRKRDRTFDRSTDSGCAMPLGNAKSTTGGLPTDFIRQLSRGPVTLLFPRVHSNGPKAATQHAFERQMWTEKRRP